MCACFGNLFVWVSPNSHSFRGLKCGCSDEWDAKGEIHRQQREKKWTIKICYDFMKWEYEMEAMPNVEKDSIECLIWSFFVWENMLCLFEYTVLSMFEY